MQKYKIGIRKLAFITISLLNIKNSDVTNARNYAQRRKNTESKNEKK